MFGQGYVLIIFIMLLRLSSKIGINLVRTRNSLLALMAFVAEIEQHIWGIWYIFGVEKNNCLACQGNWLQLPAALKNSFAFLIWERQIHRVTFVEKMGFAL